MSFAGFTREQKKEAKRRSDERLRDAWEAHKRQLAERNRLKWWTRNRPPGY